MEFSTLLNSLPEHKGELAMYIAQYVAPRLQKKIVEYKPGPKAHLLDQKSQTLAQEALIRVWLEGILIEGLGAPSRTNRECFPA